MQPIISQIDYEIRLVQHLLSNRFLRTENGKFVTARSISDESIGFETEDSLCREWLLSIYNSYHFYNGFESLELCHQYIQSTNYEDQLYRIVQFNNQFYAVIYVNAQHQQVIGSEVSYFTKNNMFLCAKRPPSNLMMKDRNKIPPVPLIYYELHAFDPAMKIYQLHERFKSYMEVPIIEAFEYAVLLGITFKDIWYGCDTPHAIAHNRALLNLYFNQGHNLTLFGKYSKAIAINPFQRLVYFPKGRIKHFQMDVENPHSLQRIIPYREVQRLQENMRTRPIHFEDSQQPIIEKQNFRQTRKI